MKRIVTVALAALILTGCQAFTRLPEAQSTVQNENKTYEVSVPGGWVRYNFTEATEVFLTKDGPSLQRVQIKERDLSKPFDNLEVSLSSNTLISEIAEHYEADIKAEVQGLTVERLALTPASVGNFDGFKLTLKATNMSGLEIKILSYGAVANNKFYALTYQAPELFFFDRDLKQFEQMAGSFQVASK